MGQKCEGKCGLWVLNEMIKNICPENLKKKCGCRFRVTCQIAQPFQYGYIVVVLDFGIQDSVSHGISPIQPNLSGNGLDWLCYLAGNF